MSISQADRFGLFSLTLVCLGAFGYIRLLQTGLERRYPDPLRALRRPRFRVVSKPTPRSAPAPDFRQNEESNEIDRLLDKIAKYGLASLSAKKRDALERARARLLEKDRN